MNLGAMLHVNGKLEEAEQSYLAALRIKPDDQVTTRCSDGVTLHSRDPMVADDGSRVKRRGSFIVTRFFHVYDQ